MMDQQVQSGLSQGAGQLTDWFRAKLRISDADQLFMKKNAFGEADKSLN